MFEANVLYFLRKYLGQYVRNIPEEALKISVWKGDVVLKDLELKAEALNELKLPVTVKSGFLGSVRLKVPWSRLGKEPVVVLLDRIFLLAEPTNHEKLYQDDDVANARKVQKRKKIEEAEQMLLEFKGKKEENQGDTNSWIGSLVSTIVGNLKISISNVHIRYEDSTSNPGQTFCFGVTLEKLAAVTVDEKGMETFVTSGALDKLRKALQLDRLAIYHDTDTPKWDLGKEWKDLSSSEWSEIFEPGIANDGEAERPRGHGWASGRQFLLRPVGAQMMYFRLGRSEKREESVPFQTAAFVLDEVFFVISERQYENSVKLAESITTYRKRYEISHLRPKCSIKGNSQLWWRFAYQAMTQTQRASRKLSWHEVYRLCQLRKKYVSAFKEALVVLPPGASKVEKLPVDIQEIEDELTTDVIVMWRMLARSMAEKTKTKGQMVSQTLQGRSWVGWLRGQTATESESQTSETQARLSMEEQDKLEELLTAMSKSELLAADEPPNMLQTSLTVTMQKNTLKFIDDGERNILEGSFDKLKIETFLYPKMVKCNIALAYYGLNSPEGTLVKSVSPDDQIGALRASYVLDPYGEEVDWKLHATIASSHVMVWRPSLDRFFQFLKSGQEASPEMVMETAVILQNTLEDVQKQAKEKLKAALLKRQRFSINLDWDAPKITVPVDMAKSCQLVLDLGHFLLNTDEEKEIEREEDALYTKFRISLTDISMLLVDGEFDWLSIAQSQDSNDLPVKDTIESPKVLHVLDKCGIAVNLHQMIVAHPSYPATKVAVRLPQMGFHFSPARYGRLMKILGAISVAKVLESEEDDSQGSPPWLPGDFSGALWHFNWLGVTSTTAKWKPRWAVLSGATLYLTKGEGKQKAKCTVRLYGKTVAEVAPSDIGNSEHVIAILRRGTDPKEVVRSEKSIILKCRDETEKLFWLDKITAAIYKNSTTTRFSVLDDDSQDVGNLDYGSPNQPLIYLTGVLDHLQLNISSRLISEDDQGHESGLLCLRSSGGKMEILQSQHDFEIGIGVHKLEVEDLYQGPKNPRGRFMAASVLTEKKNSQNLETENTNVNTVSLIPESGGVKTEDEAEFHDADEEFLSPGVMPSSPAGKVGNVLNFQAEEIALDHACFASEREINFDKRGTLLFSKDVAVDSTLGESDFVKLQIVMKQTTSPDYANVDTKIILTMTTLEFHMNRPTISALMDIGGQLSRSSKSVENMKASEDSKDKSNKAVNGLEPIIVKGLLGKGKARIVSQIQLKLEKSLIFLNLENGSQLAMLEQERIHIDVQMFPGSMLVSAILGNLRFCNMLLGPDHDYGWFFDVKDSESSSLVQIEMQSFNPEDDDYDGFDYSLSGKLSAVRIAFLYRFVSELSTYFMALSSASSQQSLVRVAVGGIESFIQQSEITGSTGIRFDISMDAPVIVMPRNSTSLDFMQLGLGHLQISSIVEWRGGVKEDPSSIRVDVITIESRNLNLKVGIGGQLKDPMVPEMAGITITVQRSLRDLFHKLPAMDVHVKINRLRGAMSEKEYLLITECALENMAEQPWLPPSYPKPWESYSSTPQSDEVLKAQVTAPTKKMELLVAEEIQSFTSMRAVVDMEHAELELYSGDGRDTSLALLQIQGVWVQYRSTTTLEKDIFVTVQRISLSDTRVGTRPEMRLAVGTVSDADSKQMASQVLGGANTGGSLMTMIVVNMEYRKGSSLTTIRLQRPRLLVAMDFLLAFGEFFVPSLAAMTGKDSEKDAREDPAGTQKGILLEGGTYYQQEGTVYLSPQKRLLADNPGIKEYIYDGQGNTLWLLEDECGTGISGPGQGPLIIVGNGNTLTFKNIFIQNGENLGEVVKLGHQSRYVVAAEDGVILDGSGVSATFPQDDGPGCLHEDLLEKSIKTEGEATRAPPKPASYILNLQALSPELTFYDSTQWKAAQFLKPEKLLRAKFDLNLSFVMEGTDQRLNAALKGLMMESSSGLAVLEPTDAALDYNSIQGKSSISVSCTDVAFRVPLNMFRLMQRLSTDLSAAMKFTGGPLAVQCRQFQRIWETPPGVEKSQMTTFWRPRAPKGYAVLGDCVTGGKEPPSQSVLALSFGYRRVKPPTGYCLVWSSKSIIPEQECCVWRPLAPPGYIAVGCVVTQGRSEPHKSTVRCVRKDLLTSTNFSDCIFYDSWSSVLPDDPISGPSTIWRVQNSMGSFFASHNLSSPSSAFAFDLRDELQVHDSNPNNSSSNGDSAVNSSDLSTERSISKRSLSSLRGSSRALSSQSLKHYASTTNFERLWWDKGGETKRHVSLWRPIAPSGYAMFGDVSVEGFDPPDSSITVLDELESGRVALPVDFSERAHISGRDWEEVTIWFPVAPMGFVALGCVVTKKREVPDINCVRCLRADLASQKGFSGKAIWTWGPPKTRQNFSFWPVNNQAHTFIVHQDDMRPPWRMAFSLSELEKESLPETLETQIKISSVSCMVFDEFTGVMTPVFDLSITGIHLNLHGRPEDLKAVILTSVAASTFNPHLGVWEPLLEPFDGIFKYESSSGSNENAGLGTETTVAVTTTSVVNLNVSSAGIDACAGAAISWRKTAELEVAARETESSVTDAKDLAVVNREEGLKILVENHLGSTIYARSAEDGYDNVLPLPTMRTTAIALPPLRFPDLTRTTTPEAVSRKMRKFIAIQVIRAKGLNDKDAINGEEFVCHLTLVVPEEEEVGQKLRQTARSRGVKPTMTTFDRQGKQQITVEWKEVFLFEIPYQGEATLELQIVNLAANAGKGSPVAQAIFKLNKGKAGNWSGVKSALGLGKSSWQSTNEKDLPLFLMSPVKGSTEQGEIGTLSVADYAFTIGSGGQVQTAESIQNELETYQATDTVVQLADSEEGPWSNMHSVTALMTVPSSVNSRPLAIEMSLRNGLKCITLRSLAVLFNDTDISLEVCVCPRNLLESEDTSIIERIEDEVFENQRYSPILGWGSAWPGHLLPSDPGQFSDAEYASSAQEIQVRCPPGWEYVDNWHVDRTIGDREGWYYGPDFRKLKGVPTVLTVRKKKASFDFVRRRRLLRTREKQNSGREVSQNDKTRPMRLSLGKLEPCGSFPLPWNSLLIGSDWCLQLRPSIEKGEHEYKWSKVVPPASEQGTNSQEGDKTRRWTTGSAFILSELAVMKDGIKREELLECSSQKDSIWLCLEADPTLLHNEDSTNVLDWRLTVQAPLRVENQLPVISEFILWEKTNKGPFGLGGRTISRQHGLIDAGDKFHVYSVDIRCQTALTWLPQGGWKHEKEAIVISDPWASDLPSHFWMVKTTSNRRLRVSIENDAGGSEISSKIIRLFVPYWLRNDTSIPLSCRLVEIEPPNSKYTDLNWLQLAIKAAENNESLPEGDKRQDKSSTLAKKIIRSIETIEDAQPNEPIMLSLPAMDNIGLAVAMNPKGMFSSAIALKAFEDKMERADLRAVDVSGGKYLKLSISLDLSSVGYERTKVVSLQPHMVLTNRLGETLFLRQNGGNQEIALDPTDVETVFTWESIWHPELMQVRRAGCDWSLPFKIDSDLALFLSLRNLTGRGRTILKADVRNGIKASRFHIVFQFAPQKSPYRIENHCTALPIRIRQVGTSADDWEQIQPGESVPFTWPEISGEKRLEVVGGSLKTSIKMDIDQEGVQDSITHFESTPVAPLVIHVSKIDSVMLVQFLDLKPSQSEETQAQSLTELDSDSEVRDKALLQVQERSGSTFSFIFKLDDLGISVVDHSPEELLYISMQSGLLAYDSDATGGSRLRLQLGHLQVDNQLASTAMPVLLAPREAANEVSDYVFRFTLHSQAMADMEMYPYIGLQLPSEAWLLNIHEPIIWRLQGMITKLNLARLSSTSNSQSVGVDSVVHIRFLNISEGRMRLTLAMAPSQRPRGALGFWTTLITSMGNTDEMLICITQKVREHISLRRSQVSSTAAAAITNDLLSQPLQLLSGLDVLGNASSALGQMSKGVAALSMDETFIRSRQRQESKQTIEGIADGLREGGEALAKSLFRGVTGILTKPVEGAQESGIEGFVAGVGKGIVGVAAQPVSGVLDLISKTTDGVNATRQKLAAAVHSKAALKRHRLPRAIRGDGLLRPFSDHAAKGQVILQLAERGALFGTPGFDLKERAKYAASDAYEEHIFLPGKKIAMLTNRRCMLLQQPTRGLLQTSEDPNLLKEPCSIQWDVTWDELMTIEEKKLDVSLVLHLRDWTQDNRLFDSRQLSRVIQCESGSSQIKEVKNAIQKAMDKYGPDRATVAAQTRRRRVESKPYAGAGAGVASAVAIGLLALPAAPLAIPIIAGVGAFVGGAGQLYLQNDSNIAKSSTMVSKDGRDSERKSTPRSSFARMPSEAVGEAKKTIRSFKLVWWDKGASWNNKFQVSIWRPIPPQGYVALGDVACVGYHQPLEVVVYRDDRIEKFVPADGFDLVWRDTDSGSKSPVTIWSPRPPPGYIGLGAVAVPDYYEPEPDTAMCVRRDSVMPTQVKGLIWRDRQSSSVWQCSLWEVMNDAKTFLARRDHEVPSHSQCFNVLD